MGVGYRRRETQCFWGVGQLDGDVWVHGAGPVHVELDGYVSVADLGVFEDLVKAGVIDPAKVTRTALQNAASIAGLMLTTEAMVSELPDDDKGSPAMPGGMGGMSGMGM